MILSAIFLGIASGLTDIPYLDQLETLWMDVDFNTIIMIVFSVTCILFFGIWWFSSS
jgi:hypothetical protein